MAEVVLHAVLLLGLHVLGEEQRTASFFQVSRDYGYTSRNSSSDHMVHQRFLPVDSFQRKACDVLRDGDGIRIHLSAS